MVVTTLIGIGSSVFFALGLPATSSLFLLGAVGLGAVALGAAALRALTPKSSLGGNRGYETTALGSALDHQVIYGKMRVGGARIYDETAS